MHFLTRLWGQERLTFAGHEWKVPFEVDESFEDMDDETLRSFDAVIVPSGMVSDRLRYTEDIDALPPATEFLQRAFAEPGDPQGDHLPRHVAGRADARSSCADAGRRAQQPARRRGNMGAIYTDEDVVVDGDLVTGAHRRPLPPVRAHDHRAARRREARHRGRPMHHIGLNCADPIAIERWYTKHFGFERKRVYLPGPGQVVVIGNGGVAFELFPAEGEAPRRVARRTARRSRACAPRVPRRRPRREARRDGRRRQVTLGPLDMGDFIAGMRVAWISDPEGNIVELNQGYEDEKTPPPLSR